MVGLERRARAPVVELSASWLEDVSADGGPLVRLATTTDGTVTGNYLCNATAMSGAVRFEGASGRFVGNLVQDVSGGGLVVESGAVDATNNTFVTVATQSTGSALQLSDGGAAIDAVNNLVAWNDNGWGAAVTGPIKFEHALLYENALDHLGNEVAADAATLVYEPPGFPKPETCDPAALVPPPGSAPIDAGSPYIVDVDGSRSDIGASGGPDRNPFLPPDEDGDGYDASSDCDDEDAYVHPGAPEVGCNDLDDDCDAATVDLADLDVD